MIALTGILRRERALIGAQLAVLVALAWLYIWHGAGSGMSALEMTSVTLFPHLHADMDAGMAPAFAVVLAMWWTMMIAMMTPGAAPLILLYERVLRHHAGAAESAYVPSAFLLVGYLLVWFAFAVVASALQRLLEPAGLISPVMLWSKSALLSAAVLAAAGLYQFSPLKRACLKQCRGPVEFLTRYWRPGRAGALMMGLRHGAYCAGCCSVLMLLLFVGGVMNLAWIAALTLLVVAEKIAPGGAVIGKISGALLLAWATATVLV